MSQEYNPRLRKVIFEIVHNQLRANDPPETKQTLDRLITDGFSKDEAMELIACVVANEIFEVTSRGEPYDKNRYVTALHALPELPWDDDD